MLRHLLFALSPLAILSIAPAVRAADLVGQASIIDGDTIEIHGQRIRLFGIDAPESSQLCQASGQNYRCGQQASFALADFIASHIVSCEPTGTDRYRRIIARCTSNGIDLNRWMV